MIKSIQLFLSLFLVLITSSLYANPFEGIIFFQKMDGVDVTYYRYYVKDEHIRIEDVNEGGVINGILLINLKEKTLKMLSCSAQMYIDVPLAPKSNNPKVKIDRTGDVKMIIGNECELWKVTNMEDRSNFEFWVNKGDYSFFTPMLNMLNRNDKIALAWVSTMMGEHYFPFEGVEYSSTGKLITKLEVLDIIKKQVDIDLFNVPVNYILFEKNKDQ